MDSGSEPPDEPRKMKFAPRSRRTIPSTSNTEAEAEEESRNAARIGTEGEYVEPWDYNTYYPIVLPWRRPNSGDPNILNQEEFGEGAQHPDDDKKPMTPAEELGLTSEQHDKERMFLFRFPNLPVMKQSVGATTTESVPESSSVRSSPFAGLPNGYMGKMQVYKSGAVKLKLGEVLYDVNPGLNIACDNHVAAIDTKKKTFCRLGSFEKLVTVTPDIDSLLKSKSEKETRK